MPGNLQCGSSSEVSQFFPFRWIERYNVKLSKLWDKVPRFLQNLLVFCAVFLFGISINGGWITISYHLMTHLSYDTKIFQAFDGSWESIGLKDFWYFFISSNIVSYAMYFGIGGFLHWYYYVRQRETSEDWKCQPDKFLSYEQEKQEIIFGSFTLFMNATMSSILTCYIANGGPCKVYYSFNEFGWTWFFLQFGIIFIYQDYLTYWIHRSFHTPWLYKNFHKLHHRYKQPTAFSVTAIHPVESIFIQSVLISPLFLFPVHWIAFYIVAMYTYYHGIIDHSGINFKSFWWQPWQPDAIFHDNHHQYFHVNFGFNIYIWDKFHGTFRQKDRIYNEDIFYGKGKSLREATEEEIEVDVNERNSENPLAYRNDKLEYQLEKSELQEMRHG